MKKCSEVMTGNPVCCLPDDMVSAVAELMRSEDSGSIPVIDSKETRNLVGIVTDRDLALRIVAEGLDAKSTKVGVVMTRKPVTCLASDDLQQALDAMAAHQLRRIPVVDNDSRVVGILTLADVATRADQPEETAELVREISQARGK